MKSLNKVQIIGNLTRDPEMKSTKSGHSVCTFGVATNRKWKDKDDEMQEEVEFHNCVAWGKLAEIVEQYCRKGQPIYVEGYLKTSKWEDKDSGKNMYKTEITANDVIMLGSKSDRDEEEEEEEEDEEEERPRKKKKKSDDPDFD